MRLLFLALLLLGCVPAAAARALLQNRSLLQTGDVPPINYFRNQQLGFGGVTYTFNFQLGYVFTGTQSMSVNTHPNGVHFVGQMGVPTALAGSTTTFVYSLSPVHAQDPMAVTTRFDTTTCFGADGSMWTTEFLTGSVLQVTCGAPQTQLNVVQTGVRCVNSYQFQTTEPCYSAVGARITQSSSLASYAVNNFNSNINTYGTFTNNGGDSYMGIQYYHELEHVWVNFSQAAVTAINVNAGNYPPAAAGAALPSLGVIGTPAYPGQQLFIPPLRRSRRRLPLRQPVQPHGGGVQRQGRRRC